MPKGSTVYIYGNLSREPIPEIDPFTILNNEIDIKCFKMNDWINGKNLLRKIMIVNRVQKLITEDLSSEVQKEFDLKDFEEAIDYYKNNMSKGKVILKPFGVNQEKE